MNPESQNGDQRPAGANIFFFGRHKSWQEKAGFLALSIVMDAVIWWMNLYAVKTKLVPLKEELETLVKSE